ncbi:sugar phosphate isomerase/epimerase family protein [Kitasatospora sp. NPDC048545]|uniref:sugar phosphate isomerase/epimerase family protein n=1 Tax=Kitasatospora sp. NPDC048545 TaxID=3157208 RepID=UPI0033F624EE
MNARPPFHLGYGTNGFANHRLDDALRTIADLGYTAVALTLDHAHLDPYAPGLPAEAGRVARLLRALGLRCVVETGARYLLDPLRKHHPTLVSEATEVRVDFLARAVRIAAELGADCVSFWSGIRPADVPEALAGERLRAGIGEVLEVCGRYGVPLGLEPEPGMHVAHLEQALALRTELGEPELLGITLDVGHCVAIEPVDAAACIRRAGHLLVNVQLDDARPLVHEHLEFGVGELDLPATLAALREVGYRGVAAVELPRHSHAAPGTAARALRALRDGLSDGHPGTGAAQRHPGR